VAQLAARLQSLVDAPEDLPSQDVVRATAVRYSLPTIAQRARDGLLKTIASNGSR
jgi:hypothetical protein